MCCMARVLPTVLRPHDLSTAELCAARLDGEVVAVDECFLPIDQADGPGVRACILRSLVAGDVIAERASAAWLYGIRQRPPAVHTVCVHRKQRSRAALGGRFPRWGRIDVRERRLRRQDVVRVGQMNVTSPECTAIDLLLGAVFGPVERAEVLALFDRFGVNAATCSVQICATKNLPGSRAALARLAELQPVLTR